MLHQPCDVGTMITKQQLTLDDFILNKTSEITIQTQFRNQMHARYANMEAEKFPSAISCGQLYKINLYELLLNHWCRVEFLTYLVGFEVLTAVVMKSTIWDITPCSPLSVNLFLHWFLAQLTFSILKMEAICSSEKSVDTQRTTRHYIPEDSTLLKLILFTIFKDGLCRDWDGFL
jgi:hypothetical protein